MNTDGLRVDAMQVQTARGPIDIDDLGRVLMHEHVVVVNPEAAENYPLRYTEEQLVEDAVRELDELKAAGIDTLVDVTVLPMGRNVRRVKRIADRTTLNIVVATGMYTFDEVPPPFTLAPRSGVDPLIDMFVRDITVGTADTGVRAAVLKCATDTKGVTPGVERVLRAVARAHRLTGAPITTHTSAKYRTGLDQQRVFAEERVDLSRVIIGHCGDTGDIDYLEALAQNGSYLGMDRFGLSPPSFDERIETLVRMCERGYAGRMVLSHDYASFNDQLPDWFYAENPGWDYSHVPETVVPALRARGVTEEQLQAMLVDNPRSIFERQDPY